MFHMDEEQYKRFVNDYKVNLLVPQEIEDTDKFITDLRYVMEFIKVSKEKEKVKTLFEKNREVFSQFKYDAAMVLKECANIKIDINKNKGRKEVDMCKAVDDMILDGKNQGEIEGKIETIIGLYMKNLLSEDIAKMELKLDGEEFQEKVREFAANK